jgi:L-asparagine transporter-like permease
MENLKLLPQKIKWVGALIGLFALVAVVLLKLFEEEKMIEYEWIKKVFPLLIILSLSLIILSRQKIEDERTNYFRLMSFTFSFLTVVFSFLINAMLLPNYNTSFSIVFQLCITYVICFYFLSTGVFQKNKKNAE